MLDVFTPIQNILKARKLLDLEGKVELSFNLKELLSRRKKDVPYR